MYTNLCFEMEKKWEILREVQVVQMMEIMIMMTMREKSLDQVEGTIMKVMALETIDIGDSIYVTL